MKTHGLVSTNNITSFSVILLTLFYVQQLDEPLVPTACELQQLAANKHIVNNWNVSFTKDRDHTSRNTMSIPDLITGFFKFYTNFEFGLYLISLFTGKSYLKSIFANQNTIPVEFSHYTDNLINNRCDKFELHKYMCVQGPFNHAHNTTRNVNQKTLINFQYFCQKNSQVLDNSQHNDDGQFLKTLFSQKDMSNEKHTAVREAMVYIGENIDFSMCTNVTEDALREHWANITVDKLKDILSQVLKCNVTTNNEKPSFGNEFKCLNCELDYPELVTNIRKDAREEFSFPKDMPLIVKETLISDYLLEKRLKGFKQTHFKFNVQCSMLRGPTRINFKLLCNESAKPKMHIIVSVFNFIQNSCVKWLQAVV
ncbi:hypothetical protein RUM43_013663 [Polyplax serrata]|uniref:PAP-associated domain-containing protein n=1 Tax=Polyplax serrata TaxID=468196 RepID=A0AAN8RZU3_POLSC